MSSVLIGSSTRMSTDVTEVHAAVTRGVLLKAPNAQPMPIWRAPVPATAKANSFHLGAKEIFVGGSNEPYGQLYHNIASLEKHDLTKVNRLISVCGDFFAPLSLLSQLEVASDVVFFDRNPSAIAYSQMILRLADISSSPAEFLGRVYGRDAVAFEGEHGKITVDNQDKFMEQPPSQEVVHSTQDALSSSERNIFDETLKLATACNGGRCMKPVFTVDGSSKPIFWHHTMEDLGPRTTGTAQNYLMYGAGWLTQVGFKRVKDALPLVRFMNAEFHEVMSDACQEGDKTVLYVMDMVTNHFLQYTDYQNGVPEQELKLWAQKCGPKGFGLVQSMGCDKSKICTMVTPAGRGAVRPQGGLQQTANRESLTATEGSFEVQSCSNWDSAEATVAGTTIRDFVHTLQGDATVGSCGIPTVDNFCEYSFCGRASSLLDVFPLALFVLWLLLQA